jgi:UDP:flavonoid glycosyltransferase YjiC (YdhE family)
MRFLFTCIPGFGHFQPIVPLARALDRAGHSVAVAVAPSFAAQVRNSGLAAIEAGLDWDESRLLATLPEIAKVQGELQGEWLMKEIFLNRSPRKMVPDLLEIIPRWRPDVVLSGTYELGGALAAEMLGIPYASCSISFRWNKWTMKRVMGKALARLRRNFDLVPDAQLAAFGRYLDICLVPRSWALESALLRRPLKHLVWRKVMSRDLSIRQRAIGLKAQFLRQLLTLDHLLHPEHTAIAANTHFIRQFETVQGPAARSTSLASAPYRRTIYVTLGTVFGAQYPEVFAAILAALSDQPVDLILTVGADVDPARFGPQPANVRIERYIAPDELATLLSHIDLCVCHSGFGTVMAALGAGIPLVLLPLSADQPVITQMCLLRGVAPELPVEACRLSAKGLPVIRPERVTASLILHLSMLALQQPRYARAAREMQKEIRSTPGPEYGVKLLEELVRSGTAYTLSQR